MRTIRLIWPPNGPTAPGSEIFLDPAQARHGAVVLRLKPGRAVEMTGPEGLAEAVVTTVEPGGRAPRLGVTLTGPWLKLKPLCGPRLALALIQGPRFDWAVEKAAELGAAEIIPLLTERTKATEAKPGPAKIQRWNRLAEEARKQCGRPTPMVINPALGLAELLLTRPEGGFFLHPPTHLESPAPLIKAPDPLGPLLVIGPEGGLSQAETEALMGAGFIPWGLGSTILRTETAALAALALMTQATHGYLQSHSKNNSGNKSTDL